MKETRKPAPADNSQPDMLGVSERKAILELVTALYRKAARHFGCSDQPGTVSFRLRGRAAGQWRLRRGIESLHFNPALFAADPGRHIPDTVAHEVAHSVAYRCHGSGLRPHGPEWRAVMEVMGFEPQVTHRSTAETLVRALNHHLYRCACRSHALGPRQHRQARNGKRRYRCRVCGEMLVPNE